MNYLNTIYNNIFLISFLFTFISCFIAVDLGFSKLWIYRLFNTPMFIVNIILFIIFLFIFQVLDLNIYENGNIILNVNNNNNNNTPNLNIGENATVNVHNPNFSASFSSINRVAAAISTTGGASVGLGVAKYVGGTPIQKLAASVAVTAFVQVNTYYMSRALNKGNNISNNTNNLVDYMLNVDKNNVDNIFNNYSLDLLEGININLYLALFFLYLIFNIYLGRYIISLNYNKYLPNNKIGKILYYLLNRYIKIWSKSSNYFLIFNCFILSCSILASEFYLYIIISCYNSGVLNNNNIYKEFENYSLNLLFTVDFLLISAIIILFIVLNVYISKYIISKNSLPKNKRLKNFLDHYLKIFGSNENTFIILGISYTMLLVYISISLYILNIIFNY